MRLNLVLAAVAGVCRVQAVAVFVYFMVCKGSETCQPYVLPLARYSHICFAALAQDSHRSQVVGEEVDHIFPFQIPHLRPRQTSSLPTVADSRRAARTTMASSPTTSANATATSMLSITTPWVQPLYCKTHWPTTTWQTRGGINSSQAFTVSEPAALCNPSGRDHFNPESRLGFSPGLCPIGWI
ncbi:hypothetical protein LZ30DRAFT_816892 [Colletotrichum cereale]|nr:hypothetical protein LZ30DRAFT_816892 [Colletotrichum cereale]